MANEKLEDARSRHVAQVSPVEVVAAPATEPVRATAPVDKPVDKPADELVQHDASWDWTPERERCLELALIGVPKTTIAKELRKHRNTINNWHEHPAFIAEFRRRELEFQNETRQRHTRTSLLLADRVGRLASRALDDVEAQPRDAVARARALDWAKEFRSWRAEERLDMGDNVTRVDQRVLIAGGVSVDHRHSVAQQSFRKFIDSGMPIADQKLLAAATDPTQAIVHLAERALVDSDLLDRIDEEDRASDGGDE